MSDIIIKSNISNKLYCNVCKNLFVSDQLHLKSKRHKENINKNNNKKYSDVVFTIDFNLNDYR